MKTVLVTGASGHLGSLVMKELLKHKDLKVIGTTRDPLKLTELSSMGAVIRAADFNHPLDLIKAFEGAQKLLLISTDAIGSRIEQHKNAIEAAVKARVKHIVYTSWPSPQNSKAAVAPEHSATEELIKKSGLSYTILRNFSYADNLLHPIATARATGVYWGSAGTGKVAYVTREDCAQVAAHALLLDSDENQVLDVTGPEAISYQELAQMVSELTGQPLKYQDISPEEFKAGLLSSGLPENWAELFVSFDLANKSQELERPSSVVEKLTGKKPTSLRNFLKAALA